MGRAFYRGFYSQKRLENMGYLSIAHTCLFFYSLFLSIPIHLIQ